MARKSTATSLVKMLNDARVVTMRPETQTVWIRMYSAMQENGIFAMRFAKQILQQKEVALLVRIDEAILAANLEAIIERGLLERDEDGALMSPDLKKAIWRSEINRENALKKKKAKVDAAPPAQMSMIMGIDGGKAKNSVSETGSEIASETVSEAPAEHAGAPPETPTTYLLKSVKESEVSKSALDEFAKIGQEAFDAAGLNPARSMANFGIVRQWLADGADRALILEVIQRKTHAKVTTLNYFTKAISEAIALRPVRRSESQKRYDRDVANWDLMGRLGPMPKLADYQERAVA